MQKSKERFHFQKEIESKRDSKTSNITQTNQESKNLRLISNLPSFSGCQKIKTMNNNQLAILTTENRLIVIQLQDNTKMSNFTEDNTII